MTTKSKKSPVRKAAGPAIQSEVFGDYYSESELPISPRAARRYRDPDARDAKGRRLEGPPWVKIFGRVYYPKKEFALWVDGQVKRSRARRA